MLLAHIVARELGVGVVRAYDADGRVAYTGTFPAAARVAVVTDLVRDDTAVRALRQLVAQQSGEVVAIGALVATSPAGPPDDPAARRARLTRWATMSTTPSEATGPDATGDGTKWTGDADPERITAMIDELAAISIASPGVTRLAYTEAERDAHRLVAGWLEDLEHAGACRRGRQHHRRAARNVRRTRHRHGVAPRQRARAEAGSTGWPAWSPVSKPSACSETAASDSGVLSAWSPSLPRRARGSARPAWGAAAPQV